PRVRFDGSGGLLSTPADYARFPQMLLNGGGLDGVRILRRKTPQLMTTNHTRAQPLTIMGPGYGFGLGVFVRTNLSGIPLVGSVGAYGWGGAWGISYVGDPAEEMFTLFFTQSLGYWARRKLPGKQWLRWIHQFEALAYQALT